MQVLLDKSQRIQKYAVAALLSHARIPTLPVGLRVGLGKMQVSVGHAEFPVEAILLGARGCIESSEYLPTLARMLEQPAFVRDLDNGRRYGTIEDFRNFVKLTYMTPFLHHSGGTVCEPVDVPVNKRHYDMVYAHMRYSDKAFMGSVTHPRRHPRLGDRKG